MARLFVLVAFSLMGCMAGAWQPTDRNRRMTAALDRAGRRANFNRKQMAAYLGIAQSLYTRQLELRDGAHLCIGRMGDLPDDVLTNFAEELCDMTGQGRVIRDAKVDALIHAIEMLKQSLPETALVPYTGQERRRA